jgi:hypothetical protein
MSELKPKPPLLRKSILFTFLIVIGIAVLAVISIPNFNAYHGYPNYPKNICINNLRQIGGAMEQWALENHKDTNAIPTIADIAPYLRSNRIPVCPAKGKYTIGRVGEDPTCSIPGHILPPP